MREQPVPGVALFRPRAWKQAVDALQGQRRKETLHTQTGVNQQESKVRDLQAFRVPQGTLHRGPFEFDADEAPTRPLLRPARQVLTVAETDFHFQGRLRAELRWPVDGQSQLPPRHKRLE